MPKVVQCTVDDCYYNDIDNTCKYGGGIVIERRPEVDWDPHIRCKQFVSRKGVQDARALLIKIGVMEEDRCK